MPTLRKSQWGSLVLRNISSAFGTLASLCRGVPYKPCLPLRIYPPAFAAAVGDFTAHTMKHPLAPRCPPATSSAQARTGTTNCFCLHVSGVDVARVQALCASPCCVGQEMPRGIAALFSGPLDDFWEDVWGLASVWGCGYCSFRLSLCMCALNSNLWFFDVGEPRLSLLPSTGTSAAASTCACQPIGLILTSRLP